MPIFRIKMVVSYSLFASLHYMCRYEVNGDPSVMRIFSPNH